MPSEFTEAYAIEQLRRSRNPFRRLIKQFYLDAVVPDVIGPAIDFACGAGQLLARLPQWSVGVEVNPFLVKELADSGLNVIRYDPDVDHYALAEFPEHVYKTFIMSHLLEHFADADRILRTLLRSCRRLGIKRIILVLPGWKGFQSDPTHKTFVDGHYLHAHGLLDCEGFRLHSQHYFPINRESIGRHYIYHELIVILDRKQ
jgi:SAM-dependent methyltransferase